MESTEGQKRLLRIRDWQRQMVMVVGRTPSRQRDLNITKSRSGSYEDESSQTQAQTLEGNTENLATFAS